MKKTVYIFILAGVMLSSCNRDLFITNPSDQVSENVIFESPDAAQTALNGTYRSLYSNNWGSAWQSEHPGLSGFTLAQSLSGEDNVMFGQGNGWFWYDYVVGGVAADWGYTNSRQYAHWEIFYTTISQANFVIANRGHLETSSAGRGILGQAYALRGFMYLCLSENFCQGNYAENFNTPGVPIYTTPANTSTQGNPRGKLSDVLTQVKEDLDEAILLFTDAPAQQHPSHIDLYTAHGLRARAAMVTGEWDDVWTHANKALEKPNLIRVATMAELGKMNDATADNVLWGFCINAEDAALYGSFLCYMDAEGGTYGPTGMQQLIDERLYNLIPDTDSRKANWWNGELPAEQVDPDGMGVNVNYCQKKFAVKVPATGEGDLINLRAEELILMAAEAACERSDWTSAKSLLSELGAKRDTGYEARIASRSESKNYNANTMLAPSTLREEVLFQRRIELWTEGMGRRFDLRRLHLGFSRVGSNHTASVGTFKAGDPIFVYFIPQTEFDNNKSLDQNVDQNPS